MITSSLCTKTGFGYVKLELSFNLVLITRLMQCETWCMSLTSFFDFFLDRYEYAGSKDRLHRAKTIDLCQNPLTVSPPK
jgi:hypothetical protein